MKKAMAESIQDQKAMSEIATVVEQLADIEHQRWSDWQKYVHSLMGTMGKQYVVDGEYIKRWEKQIDTPYSELSELEKESDREQVRRYLPIILALKERWEIGVLRSLFKYEDGKFELISEEEIKNRIAQLGGKDE